MDVSASDAVDPLLACRYCRGTCKLLELPFRKIWRPLVRTVVGIGIISLLAVQVIYAADTPITSNPIPEPILKRGIAVQVKDLGRLPDTRAMRPADQDVKPAGWARINYVRDLPDGRRFAN